MDDDVTIFYADPVDEDGNVIAKASFEITSCTASFPVRVVKVPASEIVTDEAPGADL